MKKTIISLLIVCTFLWAKTPTVEQQQTRLQKVFDSWKARLNSRAEVSFRVVSQAEMTERYIVGNQETPESPLLGLSGPDPDKDDGSGFVWVLQEQDYPKWCDHKKVRRDQENTIVHELIHVLFHTKPEEGAVIAIADVLVREK